MDSDAALSRLTGIFREIFEDENLTLSRETSAKDIDGWDSLTHVTIIITVEEEFGVKFTSKELLGLENVGQFVDVLLSKVR